MPPTVEVVVNRARQRDSSFTPQRQTVKSALTILSEWQERIVSKIASRSPEFVQEEEPIVVPLPIEPWAEGHEITEDFLRIFGGEVIVGPPGPERRVPFELVDSGSRAHLHDRPGGWVRGTRLYLVGGPGDWKPTSRIELWWVAKREELTEPGSELQVPGGLTATGAAAKWLAYEWAMRAPKEVHRSVDSFAGEAIAAEEELIWQALERAPARRGRTREVW
jgi:hypothetical protein